MKSIICILLCLSSVVSNGFIAKQHMPSNGYWIVEQNQQGSRCASVHYYDTHSKIIHTELIQVRNDNFLTNRLKGKLDKKLYLLLLLEAEKNESDNQLITENE